MPCWEGWLAVPVLGVLGGFSAGAFSRVLILFGRGLPGRLGGAIKRRRVLFAALCGLVVAGCGLLSDGAAFGTGYAQARALVQDGAGLSAVFGALKLLAAASSVSGIPGGIFAPSLAVGAGLGANVAALLPGPPASALVVLGTVAYFAGVVQAPTTAFVIVGEMTNDHALILPLMLTALIANRAWRLVCPEGVYHALAHNFVTAEAARPIRPAPG